MRIKLARRFPPTLLAMALLTGCMASTNRASHDAEARTQLATSAGTSTPKQRHTELTLTGSPPTIQAPVCEADGHCVFPSWELSEVTGDWTGRTIHVGGAFALVNEDKFTFSATVLFVGAIDGCGTGTAVLAVQEVGTLSTPTGTGTWALVPEFGSGDLAALTGGGTGTGSVVDGVRTSQLTGRISCPRP